MSRPSYNFLFEINEYTLWITTLQNGSYIYIGTFVFYFWTTLLVDRDPWGFATFQLSRNGPHIVYSRQFYATSANLIFSLNWLSWRHYCKLTRVSIKTFFEDHRMALTVAVFISGRVVVSWMCVPPIPLFILHVHAAIIHCYSIYISRFVELRYFCVKRSWVYIWTNMQHCSMWIYIRCFTVKVSSCSVRGRT